MPEETGGFEATQLQRRIDTTLSRSRFTSAYLHVVSKDLKPLKNKRIQGAKEQIGSEKCCEKPFLKHDKTRGEVFCMHCGTVIVQKTFGQPGRKGGTWIGKWVGWK